MEKDENTDEVEVEIQDNQTEGEEETPAEGTETDKEEEPKKEEGVKLSPAEFRHYKKWRDSQKEPAKVQPQPVSPQSNVEETVLLANGMPEELLAELKAVAEVRKISLIKAQSDPIFVAVKEKFEKDQKKKDASLPASRGSGAAKASKSFTTPGLSRDEHKKMVMESR